MDGSTVIDTIYNIFFSVYQTSTVVFYFFTTQLSELIDIHPEDPLYPLISVFLETSLIELCLGAGLTTIILYTLFKYVLPFG